MTKRTGRPYWQTRASCLAAAILLAACSGGEKPSKIAPTAEGIQEFVKAHGPSGLVLEIEGVQRILVVVDGAGAMYWCPRQGGEELRSRDQCVAGENFVGSAQIMSTVHRPGIETHCMQATQQLATDFGFVYAICVNSTDIDNVVKDPLAGEPYRFVAAAGEPMGLIADTSRKSALFSIRFLPPTEGGEGNPVPSQAEQRAVVADEPPARPECKGLSEALARAKAEVNRAPSAQTMRNKAVIEVEIIASGCLDSIEQQDGVRPAPVHSVAGGVAPKGKVAGAMPGERFPIASPAESSSSGSGADKTWTITGQAERRTDPDYLDMMGDLVCVTPDEASVAVLPPRAPHDQRMVWFCFDNSRAAARKLGLAGEPQALGCGRRATATVTVSDYSVLQEDVFGSDMATLVEVLSVSAPEAIECPE